MISPESRNTENHVFVRHRLAALAQLPFLFRGLGQERGLFQGGPVPAHHEPLLTASLRRPKAKLQKAVSLPRYGGRQSLSYCSRWQPWWSLSII
ncbi:hypothetical protein MTO96_048172 [Rhipicephalus appendiculatus]